MSNGTWRSKDKHRLDENEDDELPGRPANSVPDELPTGPLFSDQEQVKFSLFPSKFFFLIGATLRRRQIDTEPSAVDSNKLVDAPYRVAQ